MLYKLIVEIELRELLAASFLTNQFTLQDSSMDIKMTSPLRELGYNTFSVSISLAILQLQLLRSWIHQTLP